MLNQPRRKQLEKDAPQKLSRITPIKLRLIVWLKLFEEKKHHSQVPHTTLTTLKETETEHTVLTLNKSASKPYLNETTFNCLNKKICYN